MTRRFAREQFHKMEGANAGEVILKMAAMAEIRKAHETKEKCRLSVAYQLICRESTLVKVKKDNITGKVFESVIKIDGLQPSRLNETLVDSSYVEDDTELYIRRKEGVICGRQNKNKEDHAHTSF